MFPKSVSGTSGKLRENKGNDMEQIQGLDWLQKNVKVYTRDDMLNNERDLRTFEIERRGRVLEIQVNMHLQCYLNAAMATPEQFAGSMCEKCSWEFGKVSAIAIKKDRQNRNSN